MSFSNFASKTLILIKSSSTISNPIPINVTIIIVAR
jgi:hypothetical protein